MSANFIDSNKQAGAGEWRRGWPVVAAAMVGIGTGLGLFQNLSSLFTSGMSAEFGWTRGDIATASGFGLIGGLAAPFLGRMVDRIGVRAVIVAAMLLLAVAHAGLAAMTGRLWEYRLLVFCLALTVPGTSSLVYGKLIAARFAVHRGVALAVGTSGQSLSTLALPPVLGGVIAAGGWRSGFVALAVLIAAVALPLVLLAIRGTAIGRPAVDAAPSEGPMEGLDAREARRSSRFWRLGGGALLVNVATVGLVTQLVPFGLDHGLLPAQAALLLASYGLSQIVGRFAMGWLVDRFDAGRMAAIAAAISAAAFVGLQVEAPGWVGAMVLVFAAGLMNGAEHDLLPYLTARLFGLRAYGEVYGSLLVLSLVGTATGIVGFGRLHDLTGGYAVALAIAAGAMLLAALLFGTLGSHAVPPPSGEG